MEEGMEDDAAMDAEDDVEGEITDMEDDGDEEAVDDEKAADDMGNMAGDDMGDGDEPATKGDIADALADLQADLQAKFDSLIAGEEQSGMNDMGGSDMGMGAGEGDEMEGMSIPMMPTMEAKADKKAADKKAADKKAAAEKEAKEAKGKKKMTEAEWLREYVDKIGEYPGDQKSPSGANVGAETGANERQGEKNTKSVVAGKNDMGGTTSNIAKGGTETDPDGKAVPEPKNEYAKKRGELKGAGQFKNAPGGNAGKSAYSNKAPAATKAEAGGTNKSSPLAK
jgi:colicin import membrane protein